MNLSEKNLLSYQDAFVDRPGYNLAKKLGISTENEVLFAVFTRSERNPQDDQSSQVSALCVYSLKVTGKNYSKLVWFLLLSFVFFPGNTLKNFS